MAQTYYDDNTRHIISEILNGNIKDHVDSENGTILLYVGIYYERVKKDNITAEKYYLKAIEHDNDIAMNNLGNLHMNQKKVDLAKKYLHMAVENGRNNSDAMYNLACLYEKQQQCDLAEKYYLMAIKHNNRQAMNNLGCMYKKQNRLTCAEKYYLMAIEHGSKMALYNLGLFNEQLYNFNPAIKYYLQAILFDAGTIHNIVRLIPKVFLEQQLEILELVPQIRTTDEYFNRISIAARTLFLGKKMEMTRYLSNYLINDLVDICVSYY